MELLYAFVIAVMVGVGTFLILQENLMRIVIGVLILSNVANLIVFAAGGLRSRLAPMIEDGAEVLSGFEADPIPQALILTAIVIGFALIAFLLVLLRVYFSKTKNEEVVLMKEAE